MIHMSIVSKTRFEEDQCIIVATRSGRTTFEQQLLKTGSIAEENNLGPMEEKEQSRALSDLRTERRDAPTDAVMPVAVHSPRVRITEESGSKKASQAKKDEG
ncbi:hypothetical protein HAX54_001612 [Datura stramonium]|uniref:Uncharacterized protein n=1 Tax=Datura stramonium TaxID=4076 RepID=A0ABS8WT84_DATST|nr:hypothetical protein [Datura stramonium]